MRPVNSVRKDPPIIDFRLAQEPDPDDPDRYQRGSSFFANLQNGKVNLLHTSVAQADRITFYTHEIEELITLLQAIRDYKDPTQ